MSHHMPPPAHPCNPWACALHTQVIAGTNAQLQKIVAAAKAAHREGREFDAINALVRITAISAVQQIDLAASISALAARVAADPNIDIAAAAAELERVSL
jgi:hypothetical protein